MASVDSVSIVCKAILRIKAFPSDFLQIIEMINVFNLVDIMP